MEDKEKLLDFVSSVVGDSLLKVEEDLGDGYVRLKTSEAERRQAKHDIRSVEDVVVELLRNSRDANSTYIFVSFHKEEKFLRHIAVIDDGEGIPAHLHQKIFEPRVTSKLENLTFDRYGVHGRGMALYSVKSNVLFSEVIYAEPKRGCVIKTIIDTRSLKEVKDQSTFPTIRIRRGKPKVVRGPRNVLRTLVEFNLEHPELKIYVGSPAEIIATLLYLGKNTADKEILNSGAWFRIASAKKAKDLVKISKKFLDLDISLRNAHRIFSGEIKPLGSINELIFKDKQTQPCFKIKKKSVYEEGLSYYLQPQDLELIAASVRRLLSQIGEKYFLWVSEPKIRREGNEIKITFKLEKEE